MLSLRFQRVGKKHQPSFRLVVAEKRSKLNGPPVERLGFYDPLSKNYNLNKERINYWLSVGAKPTTSVHNLLVKAGILKGPKIKVKIRKSKEESPGENPNLTSIETNSVETELSDKEKTTDE